MDSFFSEEVAVSFKNRMREARVALNMSQDELAQKIGSTKQVISTYETGARIPKVPMAVSIATALDTSLSWLCGIVEKNNLVTNSDDEVKADPIDTQLYEMVGRLTPDQKKLFLAQLTFLEGK